MKFDLMEAISAARDEERRQASKALADLEALKSKYPGLAIYYSVIDGILVALRPSTEAVWQKFEEQTAVDIKVARTTFFYACLLHPAREVVQEMIEQRPLLGLKLVAEAVRVSGFDDGYNFRKA